jgi:hypothetical protein
VVVELGGVLVDERAGLGDGRLEAGSIQVLPVDREQRVEGIAPGRPRQGVDPQAGRRIGGVAVDRENFGNGGRRPAVHVALDPPLDASVAPWLGRDLADGMLSLVGNVVDEVWRDVVELLADRELVGVCVEKVSYSLHDGLPSVPDNKRRAVRRGGVRGRPFRLEPPSTPFFASHFCSETARKVKKADVTTV